MSTNKNLDYYKSLDYTTIVKKESLDGESWYVAYCNEFGLNACHGIGSTSQEALESFQEEKDIFIEQLFERGETIPEPITIDESFSGTFTVRTSPQVHARLMQAARANNVSLNAYINQALTSYLGGDSANQFAYNKLNDLLETIDDRIGDMFLTLKQIAYVMPNTESKEYKLGIEQYTFNNAEITVC